MGKTTSPVTGERYRLRPETQRRRNERKKAEQRALYRLRRLHRADFDRLLAEETAA